MSEYPIWRPLKLDIKRSTYSELDLWYFRHETIKFSLFMKHVWLFYVIVEYAAEYLVVLI